MEMENIICFNHNDILRYLLIFSTEATTKHRIEGVRTQGKEPSINPQGNSSPVRTPYRKPLLSLQSTTTPFSVSMAPNSTPPTLSKTKSQTLPKKSPAGGSAQFWKPVTTDANKNKPKTEKKPSDPTLPWSYKLDGRTDTNKKSDPLTGNKSHPKDKNSTGVPPKVMSKPKVKALRDELDSLSKPQTNQNTTVTNSKVSLRQDYAKRKSNIAYRASMFEVIPAQNLATKYKIPGVQKRSMSTSHEDEESPESLKINHMQVLDDKHEGKSKNSKLPDTTLLHLTNPSYGPIDERTVANVSTPQTNSTSYIKPINYSFTSPKPYKSSLSFRESLPKNSNLSKSQDSVHLLTSVNSGPLESSEEPKKIYHSSMTSLLHSKVRDRKPEPSPKRFVSLQTIAAEEQRSVLHNKPLVTSFTSDSKTVATTNISASKSPKPKPRKIHTVIQKDNDPKSMNLSHGLFDLTLDKGQFVFFSFLNH